jgi:hypothetical protein
MLSLNTILFVETIRVCSVSWTIRTCAFVEKIITVSNASVTITVSINVLIVLLVADV